MKPKRFSPITTQTDQLLLPAHWCHVNDRCWMTLFSVSGFQCIWTTSHRPPIEASMEDTLDVNRNRPEQSRSRPFAESIPASPRATDLFGAFPRS
jgi:hypothetical protein